MELKGALTNLGKYNEGELDFVWVDFPCSEEDYERALKEIGIDGVQYEETFWSDWDCDIPGLTDDLGEYASFDEVNELAERFENIDADDEKVQAVIEVYGIDGLDNIDDYTYYSKNDIGYTDSDFGYCMVDEYGGVEELGRDTLERYFDYESFGRDCKYDYNETDDGYLSNY